MRQREAVQSDNGPERRLHDAFLIASAAIANRQTANLAERQRPTADFPKMGIAKCRPISLEPKDGTVAQKDLLATCNSPLATSISNRELTMLRASASRVSTPRRTMRGICSAHSNRELLVLEILQLAENKHPRFVLIANFEPNDFFDFQAFVAAALRRAGFRLSLGARQPAGRSEKSSQRSGCSK
jgi:hypothetical protein